MPHDKINALRRKRKPVQRRSLSLSMAAHKAIDSVAKLEKASRAEAIDEIIFIAGELEKAGERFHIRQRTKIAGQQAVRKTYALYGETVKQIEKRAAAHNTTRDWILETLTLAIEPRLTHAESLRRRRYLMLYDDHLKPLWRGIEQVQNKMQHALDADDPMLEIFQKEVKRFRSMLDIFKQLLPEDIK